MYADETVNPVNKPTKREGVYLEQGEEFKEEEKEPNLQETKEFAMYKGDQGRVQSKKKPNKKGKKEEGKKGLMAMYDSDVHVADVLSYRYSANIKNSINFYYY